MVALGEQQVLLIKERKGQILILADLGLPQLPLLVVVGAQVVPLAVQVVQAAAAQARLEEVAQQDKEMMAVQALILMVGEVAVALGVLALV